MTFSFKGIASGRIVVAAVVVWIGLSFTFFSLGPYNSIRNAGNGESLLEERIGYSADEAEEWLERLGADGREAYCRFQMLDLANAFVTVVALVLILAFSLSRICDSSNRIQLFAYLPIAVGVFEVTENVLLNYTALKFPDHHHGMIGIASGTTMLKLTLGSCAFLLAVFSVIAVLINWFSRERQRTEELEALLESDGNE